MTERTRDTERPPWRCRWFGHKWGERILRERSWEPDNWQCQRCGMFKDPCDNCGRVHDPNSITICKVVRRSW